MVVPVTTLRKGEYMCLQMYRLTVIDIFGQYSNPTPKGNYSAVSTQVKFFASTVTDKKIHLP